MEYDITTTITNFVHEADSDFEQQRDEQARTLRLICCINPLYGRWIDLGVEFLLSALKLEDHDFATRIPALAHLNKSARRQFREGLEDHLRACSHCGLKHKYEMDLNESIERTLQENSRSLLQQLRAGIPDLLEANHTNTQA